LVAEFAMHTTAVPARQAPPRSIGQPQRGAGTDGTNASIRQPRKPDLCNATSAGVCRAAEIDPSAIPAPRQIALATTTSSAARSEPPTPRADQHHIPDHGHLSVQRKSTSSAQNPAPSPHQQAQARLSAALGTASRPISTPTPTRGCHLIMSATTAPSRSASRPSASLIRLENLRAPGCDTHIRCRLSSYRARLEKPLTSCGEVAPMMSGCRGTHQLIPCADVHPTFPRRVGRGLLRVREHIGPCHAVLRPRSSPRLTTAAARRRTGTAHQLAMVVSRPRDTSANDSSTDTRRLRPSGAPADSRAASPRPLPPATRPGRRSARGGRRVACPVVRDAASSDVTASRSRRAEESLRSSLGLSAPSSRRARKSA